MSEWQPIETAPFKTDVLVYGKQWSSVAEFNPLDESGFDEMAVYIARKIYEDSNNVFFMDSSNQNGYADVLATHWMPLPGPPKTGSKLEN